MKWSDMASFWTLDAFAFAVMALLACYIGWKSAIGPHKEWPDRYAEHLIEGGFCVRCGIPRP